MKNKKCKCVCNVIPDHMLKNICKNGTKAQKEWAHKSLALSARLMGRREVMAHVQADATSQTGTMRRTVFDAKHQEAVPGQMVRSEGQEATNDICVSEAYDGAGATYEMYFKNFQRNSVDDKGLRLDSTVHYGRGYDNAFWDGRQMIYGDGDGKLFNRFTAAIDVIGHELTHGVTQYEAGLVYYEQPGALNESFSDVFGILVKHWVLKTDFKHSDWIVGRGILAKGVKGDGIRSMIAPGTAYNDRVLGKDSQPGHMKDYVETSDDNGGVHINSGIINRAFYVACELMGDQWAPGKVWYIALRDRLRPKSNFLDAARLIYSVAGELAGTNSKLQKSIKSAFESVGLSIKGPAIASVFKL